MKELLIPDELKEVQGCVYKIWYDHKYIVVMGKTFVRSLTTVIDDLKRYKKGTREGYNQNNLYQNFYYHIIENPGYEFSIEFIIKTDSQYELLRHCQIELAKGKDDAMCLNSKHTPYINRKIQSNKTLKEKRGQVSRGTILNFLRWRSKTYPNILFDQL